MQSRLCTEYVVKGFIKRRIYMILIIIYMALGYWATGKTIYANSVLIGTWTGIFMKRVIMGTLLGWVLIPVALFKRR